MKRIVAELDEIAGQMEKRGLKRTAASIDLVANTLETVSKRRKASRKADQSLGMSFPSGSNGMSLPPGSEDAMEDDRNDSYTAPQEIMHRIPVGKDSMIRTTRGVAGPGEISLDIAQDDHQISIQSKKRKRRKATPRADADEDSRSTAGLPESGDEEETPPVDLNQEGDVLPFYGTDPAGSLHGGGRSGKSQEAKASRFLLSDVVANVEVVDPNSIESNDVGDMVEEDQSLGGLAYGAGYDDSETVVSGGMTAADDGDDDDDDDDDDMDDDDMDDDDDDDDDADEDFYDDDDEDDDDEDDTDFDDEDDYDDDMDDDDMDGDESASIEYP